jgi:hypothetical protein
VTARSVPYVAEWCEKAISPTWKKKTSRILTNKSAYVASKYGHVLESYRCVPLQKCFNVTVTILMLSDLEAAESAV